MPNTSLGYLEVFTMEDKILKKTIDNKHYRGDHNTVVKVQYTTKDLQEVNSPREVLLHWALK